jgi:cyclohexadienyl dehydratase
MTPGQRTARRARTFALALLATVCACWARADAAPPAVDAALQARLAPMRDVAHHKYAGELAIEDRTREEGVLARMQARGEALGLTADSSRALGTALIEASKSIQRHWFEAWQRTAPPGGPVPDLAGDLRPRIDSATDALLVAVAISPPAAAMPAPRQSAPDPTIAQRLAALRALGVDDAHAQALQVALAGIRAAPVTLQDSTLDRITRRGWLRVGMPGDYAPFAHPDASSPLGLSGIDVEIAEALARELGVRLHVVPTRWATLTADLQANRFDLALGGVSRTPGRQRVGSFTAPYFEDGKGAITRCTDVARFRTLADIDQPGVRVLVNRGGGNEQFVRATIRQAEVSTRDDNLSIFPALVRGEGDVMFTDSAEIRWQASRDARLCQALGGARLNRLDKAMFLQRDPVLRDYLDLFLVQLRDGGELQRIISRHLP